MKQLNNIDKTYPILQKKELTQFKELFFNPNLQLINFFNTIVKILYLRYITRTVNDVKII